MHRCQVGHLVLVSGELSHLSRVTFRVNMIKRMLLWSWSWSAKRILREVSSFVRLFCIACNARSLTTTVGYPQLTHAITGHTFTALVWEGERERVEFPNNVVFAAIFKCADKMLLSKKHCISCYYFVSWWKLCSTLPHHAALELQLEQIQQQFSLPCWDA